MTTEAKSQAEIVPEREQGWADRDQGTAPPAPSQSEPEAEGLA